MVEDPSNDADPDDRAEGESDRESLGDPASIDDSAPFCSPWVGLLFALVGGGLTWGAFWKWFPVFSVPEEVIAKLPKGLPPSSELIAEVTAASSRADGYNAILFVGIFGALVASCMAIGTGISRTNLPSALLGGIVGGVIGAVSGCIAGILGWGVFELVGSARAISPLARTIAVHGAMLAALGGGVGIALGAVSKTRRTIARGAAYGVVAGALAALVFPILTAICLADARTERIIPTGPLGNTFFNAQLLWIGITSALLGMLIPGAFSRRK